MSTDSKDQDRFLRKLYMEQSKGMFRYAKSVLHDEFQAEEAVQEAFTVAWGKIGTLITAPVPVGWLFETLKRIMKRMQSEEYKRQKRILSFAESQSYIPYASDELNPVISFAGVISNEELKLIDKIYVQGYTYKDLAEESGVSPCIIGMKVKRAKEKFRKKYAQ